MSFAEGPANFIASTASVSDKIRALAAAGYSRADIARMLGKRYQHVRNVLEADKAKAAGASLAAPSSEPAQVASAPGDVAGAGAAEPGHYRLQFTADGHIVVPPALEAVLGWYRGGVVIAELGEGVLTILSSRESLRRVRAKVPQWRPGEPLWSEELIADRRREAAADD